MLVNHPPPVPDRRRTEVDRRPEVGQATRPKAPSDPRPPAPGSAAGLARRSGPAPVRFEAGAAEKTLGRGRQSITGQSIADFGTPKCPAGGAR